MMTIVDKSADIHKRLPQKARLVEFNRTDIAQMKSFIITTDIKKGMAHVSTECAAGTENRE